MKEYSKDEHIRYRINRALRTIEEVGLHIENGFWNTSVNST